MKKIINIPTTLKSMYKHYLTILKPLNKLRSKEIELLAYIMYLNEVYKSSILNQEDRWNKIFSYEGKIKIQEELDLKNYSLNNMLTSLRKSNMIVDNTVPDKYIPKIKEDNKGIQLIFNFIIDG